MQLMLSFIFFLCKKLKIENSTSLMSMYMDLFIYLFSGAGPLGLMATEMIGLCNVMSFSTSNSFCYRFRLSLMNG